MTNNSFIVATIFIIIAFEVSSTSFGQTEICKWPFNKSGAVSITYDDGYITQFKKAMPVMDKLHFPGTFFIVTGEMPGSTYRPKFVGRPVKDIINESKTSPTDKDNFFERASAIRFLGYRGTLDYFFRAGVEFENGKKEEAYRIIDTAYGQVRAGKLEPGIDTSDEAAATALNTWEEFKEYSNRGHEISCHSISHPFFAILDEANMHYELEKSKEDILNHLGAKNTFSAEIPFGTEDSRVMKYAVESKIFPAYRNIMPDSFVHEINRGYKEAPGNSEKEYVQWQRGPLSKTPMSLMKSWVDTVTNHNNIWLVLVFHGVDSIGWEPINHTELDTYFTYIKNREDKLWVATFGDVTKYIRERMNTKAEEVKGSNKISISLKNSLGKSKNDVLLTLKTYLLPEWSTVSIKQGNQTQPAKILEDNKGKYVIYQAMPNSETVLVPAR